MKKQQRRRRRRKTLVGGAIIVGAGTLAYKLGKKQTQQIEQHTGTPVDQMSDEEIQGAMNDLGMQGEALTEEESAALKTEESGKDDTSYLDELERLGELKEKGFITEEEFQAKKKELLGL